MKTMGKGFLLGLCFFCACIFTMALVAGPANATPSFENVSYDWFKAGNTGGNLTLATFEVGGPGNLQFATSATSGIFSDSAYSNVFSGSTLTIGAGNYFSFRLVNGANIYDLSTAKATLAGTVLTLNWGANTPAVTISFNTSNNTLTGGNAPIPPTAFLFGSGLLGMIGAGLKRQRNNLAA